MQRHSPEQVFDDAVRQRHGRRLLQALDVDFVVHPLHPSGDLKCIYFNQFTAPALFLNY